MNSMKILLKMILVSMMLPCYGVMRIGHRGACGYAPENTLASFAKALELNVAMIELDVYCCASGELVVIHDSTLQRTTNGKGYVERTTLCDLKKLDAGAGQKIPTLDEVIELVNRRAIINIELKGVDTAAPVVASITRYVEDRGWSYDDFLISSFNHRQLLECKRMAPYIKVSALLDGIPVSLAAFAHECMADGIGVSHDCITQDYVDNAHTRGLLVYVFTVNEPDDIARIQSMGVDGIFSNYPDRVSS